MITLLATTQPAARTLAFPVAITMGLLIVRFPFVGLFTITFGSQLGGLIHFLAPAFSGWILEAVALLTIAGVAINSWREPRQERWGPDLLAIRLALLFALALVLSSIFAGNHDLAEVGLRKQLNLLVLFYLVVRTVKTMKHVKALVLAIVASTVLSAGISVVTYATDARTMDINQVEHANAPEIRRQTGAGSQGATSSAQPS